jgi:uncharacterized sporulation protein YeaH/YhbH (DUF444 family)
MSVIIDRRSASKNKGIANRQKFLKRYKKAIKRAVNDAVKQKSIKDFKKEGKKVRIHPDDVSEPTFQEDIKNGNFRRVHPGNKTFKKGDTIRKNGGTSPGYDGDGQDDFTFNITAQEMVDALFDELELPNLIKKQLSNINEYKYKRAGFVTHGLPSNLNVIRSYRNALGRQIAMEGAIDDEIAELEQLRDPDCWKQAEELRKEKELIPFLDDIDLRYNHHELVDIPITSAVMFCVMDVSGSMDEERKSVAKKFFLLLYLFLQRHYEHIDVIFIRHTTHAEEVDEDIFFHDTQTGGTIMSSGLELTQKIITERYPQSKYNIYITSASDMDNEPQDDDRMMQALSNLLLISQYIAVLRIGRSNFSMYGTPSELYHKLCDLSDDEKNLGIAWAIVESDIFPIFAKLFAKKAAV